MEGAGSLLYLLDEVLKHSQIGCHVLPLEKWSISRPSTQVCKNPLAYQH